MGFLQNLFGKKEEPIKSYADFWNWFARDERSFYNAIKSRSKSRIEKEFFSKLEPALAKVKSGIYFMTGMCDDNTVELVLAADGAVRNIVFIEELVNAAPQMSRWKFTALKPALRIEDTNIEMDGFTFNRSNLRFYPNLKPEYPDEIDITIVHDHYSEKNKNAITNGCYIFLDNFLGELQFAETIDNLYVTGRDNANEELIPIEKLKDYLLWRQKEFVEKYETTRYNPENDAFSIMEAKLQDGFPLIACINTVLLEWDAKASHPWIAVVEIEYDGTNFNGLPEKSINEFLYKIEDEITQELKHIAGNLPIGRQSSKNLRKIYYACKDFRDPSKSIYAIQCLYEGEVKMSYKIYKDKYWQTLDHFRKKVQ
jgi:hypothetical protein